MDDKVMELRLQQCFVEISYNNISSNEVVKSDSDTKYDNTSSAITVSYNGFSVGVTGIVRIGISRYM